MRLTFVHEPSPIGATTFLQCSQLPTYRKDAMKAVTTTNINLCFDLVSLFSIVGLGYSNLLTFSPSVPFLCTAQFATVMTSIPPASL